MHHLTKRTGSFLSITFFASLLTSCDKEPTTDLPYYAGTPVAVALTPGLVDEASGLADSKNNPGYLWVVQDGGNPNDICLLSHSGQVLKTINIKGSFNRDWEELVVADGPVNGTNYLYIADIGDNNLVYTDYHIYRLPEPSAAVDTAIGAEDIRFKYPDGAHDAEAMLVEASSNDIYIITKQDTRSMIYRLPYPQQSGLLLTAELAGTLPFTGAVAAASSLDGKEIIIKTYGALSWWAASATETLAQALTRPPVALSYQQEPQGEAIAFRNDHSGFYTLSERPPVIPTVYLNFYKKN